MRYNPCGRGVDMLRAGYTAPCRFFRDSDVVGTIRWFRCDPDAPPLGYESAISSLQQRGPYFTGLPVGEVFPLDFKFDYGASVPGLPNDHVCGTEQDFREGGLYLPDEPPVLYGENGLPLCCTGEPGGVMLGGASRRHRNEGVGLDGSMLIAIAGNSTFGLGPFVPLDTMVYHVSTTEPTDFQGDWLTVGDFSGGTYRIDWFQSFYPNPPTGGLLVWEGEYLGPPGVNRTSHARVVLSTGAASGSFTHTFPPNTRPLYQFTSPPAFFPPPFHSVTRQYKFIVSKL